MPDRPLEYASLKTVLLHLDANLRFEINRRMPSIRKIEKIVPLKIWNLAFDEFSTRVNDTSYHLGIYRHFPSGKFPFSIQNQNSYGGAQQDFDEFGFPVPSGHSHLLSGDVSYRREDDIPIQYDTERMENYYRQQLRRYKLAKEKYDELTANGLTVQAYLDQLKPIGVNLFNGANREEREIRSYLRHPELLNWTIENLETQLIPFDCRRNQSKPPFICYIQLTIEKKNSKRIQRFEYNKKLFEAAKQLNQVLFGCRTFPVYVSNFDFGLRRIGIERCIYRLPIGFSVHATNVNCGDRAMAHKNFKSIVKNTENLNTLRIDGHFYRGFDFHNPAIINSKKLVITTLNMRMIPEFNQLAKDTSSLDFQIKNWMGFSPEEYFGLYQSWLSGNRPIDARCCVGLKKEGTGEEVLRLVRDRCQRTETTERCVIVFINESINVEVFYELSTDPPLTALERRLHRMCPHRWFLNMRIVKA